MAGKCLASRASVRARRLLSTPVFSRRGMVRMEGTGRIRLQSKNSRRRVQIAMTILAKVRATQLISFRFPFTLQAERAQIRGTLARLAATALEDRLIMTLITRSSRTRPLDNDGAVRNASTCNFARSFSTYSIL